MHPKSFLLRSKDMDKNFKNNSNSIGKIKTPEHLKQAIFVRIEKEKIKIAQRKLIAYRIGMMFSLVASIFSGAYFGKEIFSSEFSSLVLLGFLDLKSVIVLWQDYAYSLLETLPTGSIVATLAPVFLFMILVKQYGKIEKYNQVFIKG